MPVTPGSKIGPYEITVAIGAGGMGEVFRARDTKLNRDVAIKVLPAAFADDPERLARFTREAQTLASLNHPNIATIYGIEEIAGIASSASQADLLAMTKRASSAGRLAMTNGAGGSRALVMELVEGEDLSTHIARGPIPVTEALPIARQIAEALEAAHEQGIVHRDLKPANIKVRTDGTVKVLDFGLAKAMGPSGESASNPNVSHSPTLTHHGTSAGMIIGTAAYMSPEQAKGRAVDKRTDIWAFGVVLYEMLSGARLFKGEDVSDTLAAVLRQDVDCAVLPSEMPPSVRRLVARCLERDLKRRLRDIGEARVLLENPASPLVSDATSLRGNADALTPARFVPWWRQAAPALALMVITAVLTGAAAWKLKPADNAPGIVTRFSMVLPDDLRFLRGNSGQIAAISPDGTRVAFAANGQLFLRSMGDLEARPVPGTNGLDPTHPFFSPDGQWIGFAAIADATVKKIAVSGGAPITLGKLPLPLVGGLFDSPRWEGDEILFAQPGQGIMRLAASGGEPEVLIRVDEPARAGSPQLLPGGKSVLFSLASAGGTERWDSGEIVVQSKGSAERKVVFRGGRAAQYLPTGHLVYALGTSLLAIPFDLATLEVRGGPVSMLEGLRRATSRGESGAAPFAVSSTGSLVYVPGSTSATSLQTLALADRTGKVLPLGLPPQPYNHARISPDGRQMVFGTGTDDGKESIVWVADLRAGSSVRRLTFGGKNGYPIWSRDSRSITFQSDREGDNGLFRQPADGSGAPERLTKADSSSDHRPEDWSPDGKTLIFLKNTASGGDLWTLTLEADNKIKPLVQEPANERYAAFSLDGRWFAYASADEISKRFEVFVQPFPTTGAKYQVTTDGGRDPLWSPDGRQLFYNTVFDASNTNSSSINSAFGRLVAVDVRTQPTFSFGRPMPIPIERAVLGGNGRYYDVTPDGKQFLVVMPPDAQNAAARPPAERINVVLNWFEELKQRVPMKR